MVFKNICFFFFFLLSCLYGENKILNNNEIDEKINNEKQKLQQEVKRLDIYKNCNNYELDKFLRYFPNEATKIKKCFCEKEGKNVLLSAKQEQLQNIIMDGLCSLLCPCIEKGYQVLQLDKDWYHSGSQKHLICLNTPENYKHIGISIGQKSKLVFTNGEWKNKINTGKGYKNKLCLFPASGIQQMNYYDKDNNFHNEIKIFNYNIDYGLIINPDTKDIKLTDFYENIKYTTFCDQSNEIFQNKDEIIPFFSTLSFAEIEQVLQILNKHLEGKNYDEVDIKTVLKEIKNTIEKNRKEEKKNEENSISNSQINENDIIKENNENIGPVLNEIKNKIDEKSDEEKKNEENSISNSLNDPNGNSNPINNSNNNLNNLSLSSNDLNKVLNQKNTSVKVNNINNDKGNENNIIKEEQSIEEDNENNKSETKKNDNVFDNEPNESNFFKEESIIKKSNENTELVFNKTKDKIDKKIDTRQQPKIEEEDGICCECCITCLKQCWSHNEREK